MTKAAGTSPAHPALDLAIEILADLVAFPSVSLQPNDTIVSYIETRMRDLGMRCVRDAHEDGQRFNLLASARPQRPGGVLLWSHGCGAGQPRWLDR